MFARLATALEGNPALTRRNRFATMTVLVRANPKRWTLHLGGERIRVMPAETAAADLTLQAPAEAWAEYAKAEPKVGYQNILAMMRAGILEVSGDMLRFGQHLLFLEELFAVLRERPAAPRAVPPSRPVLEPITGRYLRLDLNGREHRIYFEEAGEGIPLLCLHTAGADGRQYRGVLNDPAVTRNFRVIAFDLPWHGKSSPPAGFEHEVYRLTTDLYLQTVMTVKRALGLDRPVVMGCSIGGRIVAHLAMRHGEEFRAAIGLQSATHVESGPNTALRDLEATWRPDVHGGEASAASVACLIAPQSPSADKWETLWHYAQGGPGVFMGDLVFYYGDGDLRGRIAPPKCPLYFLTGEYDLSATPEMTATLAKAMGAAHCEVMAGLGHFPMSENPAQFLRYLRPVLDKIRAA